MPVVIHRLSALTYRPRSEARPLLPSQLVFWGQDRARAFATGLWAAWTYRLGGRFKHVYFPAHAAITGMAEFLEARRYFSDQLRYPRRSGPFARTRRPICPNQIAVLRSQYSGGVGPVRGPARPRGYARLAGQQPGRRAQLGIKARDTYCSAPTLNVVATILK